MIIKLAFLLVLNKKPFAVPTDRIVPTVRISVTVKGTKQYKVTIAASEIGPLGEVKPVSRIVNLADYK